MNQKILLFAFYLAFAGLIIVCYPFKGYGFDWPQIPIEPVRKGTTITGMPDGAVETGSLQDKIRPLDQCCEEVRNAKRDRKSPNKLAAKVEQCIHSVASDWQKKTVLNTSGGPTTRWWKEKWGKKCVYVELTCDNSKGRNLVCESCSVVVAKRKNCALH